MVTVATALVAGWALWSWLTTVPPMPSVRVATAEGSLAEARSTSRAAKPSSGASLEGVFRSFDSVSINPVSSSWPCFRGPQRENIASNQVRLLDTWPTNGPAVLWRMNLAEGHAAPAVHKGRVYLLDYDDKRDGDVLRCFALESGRELWQRFYSAKTKSNHGISRTIPAVNDDDVVTIGPQCNVMCVSATNGAFRWKMNLVERYGTKVPLWYTGQCPLLDGGEAVLAPAGTNALLIGVDAATGRVNWETPNPDHWEMSHSSIMVLNVNGMRQFIYAAIGGIAGVAADGSERGHLLWRTSFFAPTVVAPSPVPLSDGRFFMTAGYKAGCAMFQVSRSNEAWNVSVLFSKTNGTFGCEQQTPIHRDGLLFTVLPNDAGGHRQEFACMDLDGHVLWTGGPDNRFGLGPYLAVGNDRFLILDDTGHLSLMTADQKGCKLLARADLMAGQGRDAWGPMALVDGRLLLRDSKHFLCLDLRAQ